jgi:hypothetical protein
MYIQDMGVISRCDESILSRRRCLALNQANSKRDTVAFANHEETDVK